MDALTLIMISALATAVANLKGGEVEYWQRLIQAAILNPSLVIPGFPTWKTIEVGIHSCKCAYLKALDGLSTVSSWARDVVNQDVFALSSVRQTVELVKISVREMGFASSTSYKDVQTWGEANNLDPAQAEDAGYYIQQHGESLPLYQSVYFAMKAITGSGRDPSILEVYRSDDGLHLSGSLGKPDDLYGPGYVFVFRRRA